MTTHHRGGHSTEPFVDPVDQGHLPRMDFSPAPLPAAGPRQKTEDDHERRDRNQNAGERQHADLRLATVSSAGRFASRGRAEAFARTDRTRDVIPRAGGRITRVSARSTAAATIPEKTGPPAPPALQVVLAIRYPTPIQVPAQMAALIAALRTKRLRPTPATPANAAATG